MRRASVLRAVLLSVMAVAGSALALRAVWGPLQLGGLKITSPVNAQSFFGATWVLLLAGAAVGYSSRTASGRQWTLPAVAVATAALGYVRGIGTYLFADDYWMLWNSPAYVAEFPYQQFDSFFRPVGHLFLALGDSLRTATDATLLHGFTVALHLLVVGLVFALTRRLGAGHLGAFIAAALFAVHGSGPASVIWVSGSFNLLAALFLLAALLVWLRDLDRPSPVKTAAWLGLSMLAMWSKESAFVLPLLATVLAWSAGRLRWSIAPRLTAAFFLTAALFAYRWYRLGGIGGYADPSGRPETFSFEALSRAKAFGMRIWSSLLFPVNWSWEPEWWLAVLLILGIGAYAVLARSAPDRRLTVTGIAVLLISALPAWPQLVIGMDMEKSRGLYLPLVGFGIVAGAAISGLKNPRIQITVAATLIVFHFGALQHNLSIWIRASELAQLACSTVASNTEASTRHVIAYDLPRTWNGVYFFQHGFEECVDLYRETPLESVRIELGTHRRAPDTADTAAFQWNADEGALEPLR